MQYNYSQKEGNRPYLTICAIARGEASYIHEWVSFHLSLGVDRIVVVEHSRHPTLDNELGYFIDRGLVDLYRYTAHRKPQREVYNRVLSRYRGRTRWLGFIDIDEFVFPASGHSLPELLHDYEQYAGLVANWVCFGSGGRHETTSGWVTETYTERGPLDHVVELQQYRIPGTEDQECQFRRMNTHVKSFVDPDRTLHFRTAHHFKYRSGQWAVDTKYRPVLGPFSSEVSIEKLRINHYWSKSLAELEHKISRGMVSQRGGTKDHRYDRDGAFKRENASRGVVDTDVFRLLPAAKLLGQQFPPGQPTARRAVPLIRYLPGDWLADRARHFFTRLRNARRPGNRFDRNRTEIMRIKGNVSGEK